MVDYVQSGGLDPVQSYSLSGEATGGVLVEYKVYNQVPPIQQTFLYSLPGSTVQLTQTVLIGGGNALFEFTSGVLTRISFGLGFFTIVAGLIVLVAGITLHEWDSEEKMVWTFRAYESYTFTDYLYPLYDIFVEEDRFIPSIHGQLDIDSLIFVP